MSDAPRSTAALMIFSIPSVPFALVDDISKRLAGDVPTPVVEEERQLPRPESGWRDGGHVWGEQHRSKLPQPTVRRQWLDRRHVEHRAAKRTRLEQVGERFLIEQRPARHVHD